MNDNKTKKTQTKKSQDVKLRPNGKEDGAWLDRQIDKAKEDRREQEWQDRAEREYRRR